MDQNGDTEWENHSDEGREMWRLAYAAALSRGLGEYCVSKANHAMDLYEQRFYPKLYAENLARRRARMEREGR